MRLLLLASVALLGLSAVGARAQTLQDRYGPPTQTAATAAALRGSQTAVLSWPGKVSNLRGAEEADGRLRNPAPLDTSTGYAVRSANAARYSQAARTPQPQMQRLASAPPPPASAPARLPTSLYDDGAAAPAAPTQRMNNQALPPAQPAAQAQQQLPPDQQAWHPPAWANPLAQPAAQAQQPAQPAAQPATQTASVAPGEQGARFYSLHREYGLQPDPTPPAQSSVLELSPTVAMAMQDSKDDSGSIDLAGQDQAQASQMRPRNNTTATSGSSSSTSSNTKTYTTKTP